MAAYLGIAAHSAYDMFCWYKYLSVIFPIPRFIEWEFFLTSPFPDHCLLVPFYILCNKIAPTMIRVY